MVQESIKHFPIPLRKSPKVIAEGDFLVKSIIVIILIGLVAFLGFSISGIRKELLSSKEYARQIEERNSQLQRELMRLNRVNSENERFLSELEQGIKEFENKLPFSSLEKYIPKPILNDVKPIIEKLQAFQEGRENAIVFNEQLHESR